MSYQDQFPKEFGRTPQIVGNDKYSQIMELMRRRNAMNNSTYTGGFNAYPVAAPSSGSSSAYDELLRLQALNNTNRGGGRGESQQGGFRSESPMAGPGPSTFMGNLALGLDAYGNALGGLLPSGFLAQYASQAMLPYATTNEAKANQERLASLIAADPTYGGGGYGSSVANGGYGVTSPTGAGIASNSMGNDVATAQGQQSMNAANAAAAANQAMTDAANAQATKDAIAAGGVSYTSNPDGSLSPTGGNVGVDTSGRSDGPNGPEGRGEPGGDRGGWGRGGGYAKGGKVTMDRLQGPNPMGPDDGYGGLDDGEYVINAKSVGKYGIELMNAINAGKISKGKLRGLLEA
jgi:hypothetical protein